MILLDTNYLIRSLVSGTMEARRVKSWVARDEELCTSAVAWYEFLCGPADEDGTDLVREIIADRVIPFAANSATEAARLFNAIGRVRSRRVDAMIAATAIISGAALATEDADGFRCFESEGLRLV